MIDNSLISLISLSLILTWGSQPTNLSTLLKAVDANVAPQINKLVETQANSSFVALMPIPDPETFDQRSEHTLIMATSFGVVIKEFL